MNMGLHAGFYTQHLLNAATSIAHGHELSAREDQFFFMKEFLKSWLNQTTCSRCQQTFSPDRTLPEWLGEREEGP